MESNKVEYLGYKRGFLIKNSPKIRNIKFFSWDLDICVILFLDNLEKLSKNIFLHSWSIHEVMDPKLKRFYQPKFILLSIVSEYYYFLYKINKSLRVIQVDFR